MFTRRHMLLFVIRERVAAVTALIRRYFHLPMSRIFTPPASIFRLIAAAVFRHDCRHTTDD